MTYEDFISQVEKAMPPDSPLRLKFLWNGNEQLWDEQMENVNANSNFEFKDMEVGKIYVFAYQPSTPGIRYDQNPLVAVTNVFEWGFKGINFHWGQSRSYTFQEVASQLYQVTNEELQDLNTIPFAKFRINN